MINHDFQIPVERGNMLTLSERGRNLEKYICFGMKFDKEGKNLKA